MKISDIIKRPGVKLSIEVFPPKKEEDYAKSIAAIDQLAALNPAFMSVTYGAGGTNAGFAARVAVHIEKDLGVPALGHLTCIGATPEGIDAHLAEIKAGGVENILALRGDIPPVEGFQLTKEFTHASDLAAYVKSRGDFCIGGACYPEGHAETPLREDDIDNLKKKVDAGAEFLTTQLFFDNNLLYNFMYRLRSKGISVPVVPGIMPVTNAKAIKRTCQLSNASLPARFKAICEKFGSDPKAMTQAGIAYATEQIIDLIANGFETIHLYSMNKPEVAAAIFANLSDIIGK